MGIKEMYYGNLTLSKKDIDVIKEWNNEILGKILKYMETFDKLAGKSFIVDQSKGSDTIRFAIGQIRSAIGNMQTGQKLKDVRLLFRASLGAYNSLAAVQNATMAQMGSCMSGVSVQVMTRFAMLVGSYLNPFISLFKKFEKSKTKEDRYDDFKKDFINLKKKNEQANSAKLELKMHGYTLKDEALNHKDRLYHFVKLLKLDDSKLSNNAKVKTKTKNKENDEKKSTMNYLDELIAKAKHDCERCIEQIKKLIYKYNATFPENITGEPYFSQMLKLFEHIDKASQKFTASEEPELVEEYKKTWKGATPPKK